MRKSETGEEFRDEHESNFCNKPDPNHMDISYHHNSTYLHKYGVNRLAYRVVATFKICLYVTDFFDVVLNDLNNGTN
jgi:hypothetical protein